MGERNEFQPYDERVTRRQAAQTHHGGGRPPHDARRPYAVDQQTNNHGSLLGSGRSGRGDGHDSTSPSRFDHRGPYHENRRRPRVHQGRSNAPRKHPGARGVDA